MVTCANCENDALYVYEVTRDVVVNYCDKDLPGFLKPRRDAGALPTTEAYAKLRDEALTALTPIDFNTQADSEPAKPTPKKAAKKKPSIEDIVEETAVVEEELVEEVIVAEIVEEEPVSEDAE